MRLDQVVQHGDDQVGVRDVPEHDGRVVTGEHQDVAGPPDALQSAPAHGDVVPTRVQELPPRAGAESVHDDEPPGRDDVALRHPPEQRDEPAEDDEQDRDGGHHDVDPGELGAEHPEPEPPGRGDQEHEDRRAHEPACVRSEPRDDAFGRRLGGHAVMHTAGG